MTAPTYEALLFDVDDGVATLTLNRPDRMNAFGMTQSQDLISALDVTDADDSIKAVIITGAGKAFSSGADLTGGGFARERPEETGPIDQLDIARDGAGVITLRLYASKKPLIAAVNGPAVGMGATIQLGMDIRLASTAAHYHFVFGPPRHRTGGVFDLLPAAAGRHRHRDGMVRLGPPRSCPRGPRTGPGPVVARAGRAVAGGARHRPRDGRQRRPGVHGAHPPDDVADDGRLAPDGGPPRREPGPALQIPQRRRSGGVGAWLERREPAFPDKVSELPDIWPGWIEPTYEG